MGLPSSFGYCAGYKGEICEGYLSNPGYTWFNITSQYGGSWLNEQIIKGALKELTTQLSETCYLAARVRFHQIFIITDILRKKILLYLS